MYVYRKQSEKRAQLAKQQAKEYQEKRKCPGCSGTLVLTETGKDRNSYVCEKCNAVCTFTLTLPEAKKGKETKLQLLTIRDKSKSESDKPDISNEEIDAACEVIRESMDGARLLTFTYVNRQGKRSTKTVEPYKLAKDGSGNPILYGFCTESEGTRMYKIVNMFKLEIQSFTFKPKWDMEDKLAKTESTDR